MKESKKIIDVEVFRCVAMRHDETAIESYKEDGNEWRVEVTIVTNRVPIVWEEVFKPKVQEVKEPTKPKIKWTDIKF